MFAKLAAIDDGRAPGRRADPGRTRRRGAGERPARLASAIADEIQAVLRSIEPLDHDQAMESLGLDSLMALELRNRLEASLGITLPVALVWAYPTISALAGALCERMGYETVVDTAEAHLPRPEPNCPMTRHGTARRPCRGQRTRSENRSGRIVTSLAERAAQLSPQAREVLARELIRAGTVFPVDTVAEPVAVVGIGCRFPGVCWAGEFLAVAGRR